MNSNSENEIKIEGPEDEVKAEEIKEEAGPEAAEAEKAKEAEGEKPDEGAEEKEPEPEKAEETAEKEPEAEKKAEDKEQEAETKKADEDLQTKYLRLAADFQNFRRRTEKEKSDIYAFANEKIMTDALTVLDNFDRAMDAAPKDDKFAEGMSLIHKQFSEMLVKHGLKEIEALDKPFDPQFHNAVQRMAKEGAETDTVITVLQKGYILNGKVIRPSMVIVAE
jgi:molecular chaperone GrpE